jgi:hypothetical protein
MLHKHSKLVAGDRRFFTVGARYFAAGYWSLAALIAALAGLVIRNLNAGKP